MKALSFSTRPANGGGIPSGFALVATLMLMLLLGILAIGMLSLSSISLRGTSQNSAMSEARSNARMALMLALGELQKQMGPDQRISANGGILEAASTVEHPHWTGAWDSWIAGDPADAPVNPDYPSAASHHQTLGAQPDGSMRPEYGEKGGHFRAWLISLDAEETTDVAAAGRPLDGAAMPAGSDTAVRLVGEGSLGDDADPADFVSARILPVSPTPGNSTGRYGWWVGDESQKASILEDPYKREQNLTDADHIHRSQAPGAMATKLIQGLGNATDEDELDNLPSLKSLDLVTLSPAPTPDDPTVSQRNFHDVTTYNMGLLADVREGGLKRDLSTLLRQPIRLADSEDEYMLYRFGSGGEDRVPIQDLSAYYQLHDNEPAWEGGPGALGGIRHKAEAARIMDVTVPDYGADGTRDKYLRQYTSLYRSPVPVRVQFVVGIGATPITQAERDYAASKGTVMRESDKYKMLLGVKPVVSLWNPNNVPLVMGTDASQIMKVGFPPFALRWKKYRAEGAPTEYVSNYLNLNYSISNESTNDGRARSLGPYIMQLQFAKNSPIVFEPGEVKMFSIPINGANFLESGGSSTFGNNPLYQAEEFLPDGFYVTAKSAVRSGVDVVHLKDPNYSNIHLVFGDNDRIDMEVVTESQLVSRAVSSANEVKGSALQFWMSDAGYGSGSAHFRNYQFISRFGGTDRNNNPNYAFNRELMLSGFPGREEIPFEGETNAVKGSELLDATARGEAKALLNFFMTAGVESAEANAGGAGAGRRTITRPFLHGSTLSAPQITGSDPKDLYDYGWEWQVNKINNLEEAFHDDDGRGFYGGGYTAESGTTHVVQQYLPALPPISIAELSNAHLGGFSLANNAVMSTPTADVTVGGPGASGEFILRDAPSPGDFRQVTATGQGGLAPHTLQAIGNSYAHPNVPANKAFATYTQFLNSDTDLPTPPVRTYADHSYLANKALWDDFFFSSITAQSKDIPLYGISEDREAVEVARQFFFEDETTGENVPLPNHRMVPYKAGLTEAGLTGMFSDSEQALFANGVADKIASHLMVAGSFNINSTSVEAWKVFLSSLKGKPMAYLKDEASSLATVTPEGTQVAPGMLPNGEPIGSGDLSGDPNAPPEQWTSPRVLSDQEIDELAVAMVEQVKKRGPFLSLSEFVNRRLENDPDAGPATKGALQAAIDDEGVSINAAFRTPARSLDGELGAISAAFPEALEGPIAYGSTPYVDQADILRHCGSILSPRGDTFVIRAYGDSLNAAGDVVARAWCEATVQRLPVYVDGSDAPEVKQEALTSAANRQFGRPFEVIRFRWLNPEEV